jgi:hypothetical protein
MFAVPWLLTMLMQGCALETCHVIIDQFLIRQQHPNFLVHACVALLISKRTAILSTKAGRVPEVVSRLSIATQGLRRKGAQDVRSEVKHVLEVFDLYIYIYI